MKDSYSCSSLENLQSSEAANCRGNALLELALVLPFLVLLIFATIEFTKIFHRKEMMNTGATEAAKLAYRNCYDLNRHDCTSALIVPPSGMSAQDLCLTNYAFAINQTLHSYIGNDAVLTINIYRWNPTTNAVEWYATTRDVTGNPTRSKYNTSAGDGSAVVEASFKTSSGDSIVEEQGFIVISEVFIPYDVTFSRIVPLPEEMVLYERAVL